MDPCYLPIPCTQVDVDGLSIAQLYRRAPPPSSSLKPIVSTALTTPTTSPPRNAASSLSPLSSQHQTRLSGGSLPNLSRLLRGRPRGRTDHGVEGDFGPTPTPAPPAGAAGP